MASSVVRRPLPALVALLALLLLTGIVWWRVVSRDDAGGKDVAACPSGSSAPARVQLPSPEAISVQVLNSTDRRGLAGQVSSALAKRGFDVPKAGRNDNPKVKVRGVAQIRYGPAAKRGASVVKYFLPGAVLVPTQYRTDLVYVSVGAGYKALATDKQVSAALAADSVSISTTAPAASASPGC